ncbi:uncharacterized protein si:ch211-106e7.2 [Megalops cyprinoides]|uniref:uncharacterized protein si:ch211-106e7.2 n=1 Tax=Megalops cyprinoides TaxID=118141 RepID=UPI001863E430|nr:uncharacterized protein si:ch211-106e7.2 [Megalops cyprinoides]
METLPRFEGSQNQAFCLPPSNSANQNGNGFQGVTTGGWFNGNLSDKVSGGQPTMATNLSTHTCPQYFTHNGQTANGNYWKNQAMGSNSVRNSYPFSAQRNGNGIGEAVPQMPLRNQALMNGNGNCIVSSGKHAPTFQYPAGQTLWRADVPKGYQGQDLPSVTNTANPQMMADNRNYYNSQEVFPRVSNGAWAATSQGQRNHNIYQHYLQRMMCGGQGTSPVNPLRQKLNPHYFQGTAVTGQGVVNSENGAMNKNQREGVNGPAVVGFPHAGDRTIMRQGMTSRRNGTGASPVCGNLAPVIQNANPSHFQGAMNRSQGPAVSSPTTTVRHFPGQSAHSHTQVVLPRDVTDDTLERILWALVLKSQTDPTQRNENGGGNVTTAPERTAELQLGSSAPTGDLRSTLNLPCPRGSGNQNINQLGHFGAGLQNVTQQQPVCHLPSSGATANVVADPSCTGKQGSLRLPAGQPPPRRAQNPVRRNAQGTGYRMQSHNGSAQPPSFPGTLNGCVAKGVGHTGSPTMVTHTAKQLPVSVDNRNGNCARASNASNGHSSSSPNQGGQLCVKQPAADTPPYPKRHGYFVTVTEDRLGKGFTAENVIFVGNQPADNVSTLQGCQIPPAEKTVNLDCGGTIGELSGNGSPDKHDTNLSASVTSAESMFNQPKASNQQNKSACSSSQRAVAVLDDIDKEHGFPFHLRFGRCILEEEEEESKGKEVNECDDKPGEAASESQAEKEGPAPTGVEMDTPIDPLSALEINVLPPEDAVRFFRGDVSTDAKAEDLQREGGKPASELHITEGQRKTLKGQETARSPQSKIVPGKLPARPTCLNKNENQKSAVTKSPENKSTQTQQQTEESVTGRSKNGKRHDTAALSSSPEEDASVKREKGAEPARRQSRRLFAVGKPDAGRRSRHDAGIPAVIPSQKENCVLDFKLLPESFSFKDDRDLQGPAKRRNPVKIEPVCPKVSDKQPESLKKTSWGAQGSWSKHSGSKRPTSSKTMSSRETTSSTFQEYKKKYMAQGKK